MKILFVRHGESEDDIEDCFGGWADFNLTAKGEKQASESANKISSLNEKFDIVLSSPLKRAFQLAKIISSQLGLKIKVYEYLKERNLNGVLTGMVRSEAKEKYPEQVEAHNKWEYVDGSERVEDFDGRVNNAIKYILRMEYNSLIAVTHGLFMKAFYKEILNIDISRVGDGGFVLVEEIDGKFNILKEDGIKYKLNDSERNN